jgi:hypothetical protein
MVLDPWICNPEWKRYVWIAADGAGAIMAFI